MKIILLGNILSLLAMCSDSFSSSRKTTKGVLMTQNLSQVFYGLSSLVLGGYSAAVQNVVSILRNFVAMSKVNSKVIAWGLIALGVVLGVFFNNLGLVGWLPIIANFEYSIAVFKFKDNERALKSAFLVCCALFTIFNVFIYNVVGVISNTVVIISIITFLVKGKEKTA
ncbi:MAG: YgjV family protein [Firmicutes bacterium]|nr:YgjV family protein [Bacillota bacterium]